MKRIVGGIFLSLPFSWALALDRFCPAIFQVKTDLVPCFGPQCLYRVRVDGGAFGLRERNRISYWQSIEPRREDSAWEVRRMAAAAVVLGSSSDN